MQMCRQLWTTFNEPYMATGLAFVIGSVVAQFLLTAHTWPSALARPVFWMTLLVMLLRSASLWSNSYIESERSVSYYLLTGLALGLLWQRLKDTAWMPAANGWVWLPTSAIPLVTLRVMYSYTFGGQHDNYFTAVHAQLSFLPGLLLIGIQVFAPIFIVIAKHTQYLSKAGRFQLPLAFGLLANLSLLAYRIAHYLDLLDASWSLRILLPNIGYSMSLVAFFISGWNLDHLFPLLSLVGGPSSSVAFCLLRLVTRYLDDLIGAQPHSSTTLTVSVCYMLLATLFFYATGHQPQFSSFQFAAPFTGFDEFNKYLGGLIVTVNTWSSHLLLAIHVYQTYKSRTYELCTINQT